MKRKSNSENKRSIAKKQVETSPLLPSTDILKNLIGGPELHVPDWLVWKHIHKNCRDIPALPQFILWTDYVLEKSAGRINRGQVHCRETIAQTMGIAAKNIWRYESQWIEAGWMLKNESGGRVPSQRTLGRQFDHIRMVYASSNRPQVEASSQKTSSNPPQVEASYS